MKSKTGKKKELQNPAGKDAEEQGMNENNGEKINNDMETHAELPGDTDDDLPEEHIRNLDEALKGADRGEPVTLKEFKKMAKKWGTKEE